MLASKSKLAIARLIVIIFGIIAIVLSIASKKPVDYFNFTMLFFAVSIFAASFLSINYPRKEVITAAPALTLTAIFVIDLPSAVVGAVIAYILSYLVKSKKLNLQGLLIETMKTAVIVFTASYVFLSSAVLLEAISKSSILLQLFVPAAITSIYYFIVYIALERVFFAFSGGSSFLPIYIGSLRTQAPVFFTFSVISLLMAFMYETTMGYWSIITFSLPLVVTGHSFKLYIDVRRTYEDTIAALANTIEAQNKVNRGHAERVTSICVDIAREMGMYGKSLENLSYAALLHDIGHLGFESGMQEPLFDSNKEKVAKGIPIHSIVGADILGQVDYLKDVSGLVKYHHYPFQDIVKKRGEKEKFPLGARIIQVASDFDKLVNNVNKEQRLDSKKALKTIRKDQGYIYDPKVLRAFSSILKKQGKL